MAFFSYGLISLIDIVVFTLAGAYASFTPVRVAFKVLLSLEFLVLGAVSFRSKFRVLARGAGFRGEWNRGDHEFAQRRRGPARGHKALHGHYV